MHFSLLETYGSSGLHAVLFGLCGVRRRQDEREAVVDMLAFGAKVYAAGRCEEN
jgi:hypothetical protein